MRTARKPRTLYAGITDRNKLKFIDENEERSHKAQSEYNGKLKQGANVICCAELRAFFENSSPTHHKKALARVAVHQSSAGDTLVFEAVDDNHERTDEHGCFGHPNIDFRELPGFGYGAVVAVYAEVVKPGRPFPKNPWVEKQLKNAEKLAVEKHKRALSEIRPSLTNLWARACEDPRTKDTVLLFCRRAKRNRYSYEDVYSWMPTAVAKEKVRKHFRLWSKS